MQFAPGDVATDGEDEEVDVWPSSTTTSNKGNLRYVKLSNNGAMLKKLASNIGSSSALTPMYPDCPKGNRLCKFNKRVTK